MAECATHADTPTDFPARTQKVKVLFDVDREAFWDLYVGLMMNPAR